MTWSMGLHLGEAIFEIVGRPDGEQSPTLLKSRSFNAQNPPELAFLQFVSQNSISQISRLDIATSLPLRIIESGHGNPAAILTTSGFENWIEMGVPLRTSYFTARPRRPSLLIDREFIFGVGERTNAQGHIEKLVEDSELEFLVTKLELHGLKHVALCFLHSQANNTNEKRVADYLMARGYHVFMSSQSAATCALDEKVRFWTAVLNAYVSPYFIERLTALKTEMEKVLAPDAQVYLGRHTFQDVLDRKVAPLETAFSLADRLAQNFAKTSRLLYCGLDEFVYFQANPKLAETYRIPLCEFAAQHMDFKRLEPQPLTQLGKGFFSELTYSHKKMAFDPGPMIFGRGLTPSLLDLLMLDADALENYPCLKDKVNDRGRQRLVETLTAYSRTMSEGEHLTAHNIVDHLIKQAQDCWGCELEVDNGLAPLKLCGPLATVMHKYVGGEVVGDDFFTTTILLLKGS